MPSHQSLTYFLVFEMFGNRPQNNINVFYIINFYVSFIKWHRVI